MDIQIPKGKLYAKYYNAMWTLKTSGLYSKEQVKTVQLYTQRRHDNEFGKMLYKLPFLPL